MARSPDELTAVAHEGSVGPLTLAVGAGALAVEPAAGPTCPPRRIASASGMATGRNGQLTPLGRVDAARRHWSSLVEEARAADEAGRAPASSILLSTDVAPASGVVSFDLPETNRTRDPRGRCVRRATHGVQPE